jgi:hypothetical protein
MFFNFIILLYFWLQNENQVYKSGNFFILFSSLVATENLQNHFIFFLFS